MDKIKTETTTTTKDIAQNEIVKIKKESGGNLDLSIQLSKPRCFQSCKGVTQHAIKLEVPHKINAQTGNILDHIRAQDSIAKLKANGWDTKYILSRLSRKEMDQIGIDRSGEQAKIESMGAYIDINSLLGLELLSENQHHEASANSPTSSNEGELDEGVSSFSSSIPANLEQEATSRQMAPTGSSTSPTHPEPPANSPTSPASSRPELVGMATPLASLSTSHVNHKPKEVPLKEVFKKTHKQDQLKVKLAADIIDRKKRVKEFNSEELDDFTFGKDDDPAIWVLRFTFYMCRFDYEFAFMCALLFKIYASKQFSGLENYINCWFDYKASRKEKSTTYRRFTINDFDINSDNLIKYFRGGKELKIDDDLIERIKEEEDFKSWRSVLELEQTSEDSKRDEVLEETEGQNKGKKRKSNSN